MPDARLPSVDRALWNLAEVASRYSDGKSDEERRAVWAAIEAAVTQARSMFDSREAAVAAARQVAEVLRQQAEEAEAALASAVAARGEALTGRAQAVAARSKAEAERDVLLGERDHALYGLARAEEALDHERASATATVIAPSFGPSAHEAPGAHEVFVDDGDADEVQASEAVAADEEAVLVVRATMGNLLPANLQSALPGGGRILRRDGRLAALVALPCGAGGQSEHDDRIARLRAAGLRVEWAGQVDLAS